jgi:CheY-like chemotaxis protein
MLAVGNWPDLKVLVVEDDALVAWDVEAALLDAGCLVVGPANGIARATELMEEQKLDLVVLDLNLGKTSSVPFADRLQQRGIPFIFLTGHSREFLPERHRDRPLVSKPFHPSLLIRAVQQAIQHSRAA